MVDLEHPLPAWCFRITLEVLRSQLDHLSCAASERLKTPKERRLFQFLNDSAYIGWRLAKGIGTSLSKWPANLLAEFGVLSGCDFDRVQAMVVAENERDEREYKERRKRDEVERLARAGSRGLCS